MIIYNSNSSDTSPPCGTFIFLQNNQQVKNKRATLLKLIHQNNGDIIEQNTNKIISEKISKKECIKVQ
jgi:hypothetical protein